jgi:hypothetical protein
VGRHAEASRKQLKDLAACLRNYEEIAAVRSGKIRSDAERGTQMLIVDEEIHLCLNPESDAAK